MVPHPMGNSQVRQERWSCPRNVEYSEGHPAMVQLYEHIRHPSNPLNHLLAL